MRAKMKGYSRKGQSGDLSKAVDRAKKHRSAGKKGKTALVAASLVAAGTIIAGGVAIANDEEQVTATEQRLDMMLDADSSALTGIDEIEMLADEQTIFNSYFRAHQGSATGPLVEIEGTLEEIVKERGIAWLRMESPAGEDLYVHPTAIVSASYGEHPAEKLLRLVDEHDLKIDPGLLERLSNKDKRDSLCRRIAFTYEPERKTIQVVSELLMDGIVITMMDPVPKEWRAPNDRYLTPLLFEVPSSVLDEKTHKELLFQLGYSFSPDIFSGSSVAERVINFINNRRMGMSIGSRLWMTDVLRELGLPLEDDVKTIGHLLKVDKDLYFTTTNGTYDTTEGNFYKLTEEGEIVKLLTAPGRFFTAVPHPQDNNKMLISTERVDRSDPRFGCFLELDITTGDYRIIEFPEGSRDGDDLLATNVNFTPDAGLLFTNRYGFHDEGGGVWVLDMDNQNYETKRKLVKWDHMLMYTTFGYLQRYPRGEGTGDGPVVQPIAITGKEVEDSFAMTVNHGWLTVDGMDSSIDVERVGRLVGWNPSITLYERTDDSIRVFTTISYNYDAYMDSRPFAIYRTLIDLEGDGEYDLSEMPVESQYLEVPEQPSED